MKTKVKTAPPQGSKSKNVSLNFTGFVPLSNLSSIYKNAEHSQGTSIQNNNLHPNSNPDYQKKIQAGINKGLLASALEFYFDPMGDVTNSFLTHLAKNRKLSVGSYIGRMTHPLDCKVTSSVADYAGNPELTFQVDVRLSLDVTADEFDVYENIHYSMIEREEEEDALEEDGCNEDE